MLIYKKSSNTTSQPFRGSSVCTASMVDSPSSRLPDLAKNSANGRHVNLMRFDTFASLLAVLSGFWRTRPAQLCLAPPGNHSSLSSAPPCQHVVACERSGFVPWPVRQALCSPYSFPGLVDSSRRFSLVGHATPLFCALLKAVSSSPPPYAASSYKTIIPRESDRLSNHPSSSGRSRRHE